MTKLPEDFSCWPSDPFELLNLERSVDARTAKRVYFKLIRKYKPDRFPNEFQKIREAYEAVQNWLSWQDYRTDDDADAVSETANETEHTVEAPMQCDSQTPENEFGKDDCLSTSRFSVPATRFLKTEPVELFFETLEAQGFQSAVAHLQNVDPSQGAQVAKTSLLRYFAVRFYPQLMSGSPADPANDEIDLGYSKGDLKRVEWLLKALNSTDSFGAAMAQLRFEFDRNYRLANCKSVNDYLSKVTDYATLASLYKLRWEAIGHFQPYTVINDIKSLQPKSLEFEGYRGDWLSLLTESMNYTVWQRDARSSEHTEVCWQEISTNDQTWSADAIELMMLGAEEWKEMYGSASGWMAAIPWARNTLPQTFRSIWLPVAQEIAGDPVAALKDLDYRFRLHSMAMTVFEEGLRNLAELEAETEAVDDLPWDETRELVACYLMELGTNDYGECRDAILKFCILNQLGLMTFAAAANTFMRDDETQGWFELMQRDAAMRCVLNACHVANW